MKINFLIDQKDNFFHDYKVKLKNNIKQKDREIKFIYHVRRLQKGDILFILGTNKILNNKELRFHKLNVVIHPSKLPQGRGSAAVSWNILNRKNFFYISLIDAVEKFDSGDIYYQEKVKVSKFDLCIDIRKKQALKIINLIKKFLKNYKNLKKRKQLGKSSFFRKRFPDDSEIDLDKSLRSQLNLLRIVDNDRYPAFFKYGKYKYFLKIYRN